MNSMSNISEAKVGVIGAGAWGTAVARELAGKGIRVVLWSFEADVAEQINEKHTNGKYLPAVKLPELISATTDLLEAARDREFLILVTPSLYLADTVKQLLVLPNIMDGTTHIGVLTKGFVPSPKGPRLIIETLEDHLPGIYRNNLVYISGPSHAEEVARNKLTGLISACPNGKNSIRFRELLSTQTLMVFSSFDVVGVQICAAVKNVIAIAFGMLDALKSLADTFGDNTESLLLAAGLNEIQSLGRAMGATHPETFTSIAGVGDLEVTCRSEYGRNRRFGREIILDKKIARYRNLDELLADINNIGYLPEGAVASRFAWELAQRHRLKLPIIRAVYRILNREEEPLQEVENMIGLLTRSSSDGMFASEDGEAGEQDQK